MYCGEVKIPNSEMESFISAANDLNVRGLCNLPSKPESPNNLDLTNKSRNNESESDEQILPEPEPERRPCTIPKKRPFRKRQFSNPSSSVSGKENSVTPSSSPLPTTVYNANPVIHHPDAPTAPPLLYRRCSDLDPLIRRPLASNSESIKLERGVSPPLQTENVRIT